MAWRHIAIGTIAIMVLWGHNTASAEDRLILGARAGPMFDFGSDNADAITNGFAVDASFGAFLKPNLALRFDLGLTFFDYEEPDFILQAPQESKPARFQGLSVMLVHFKNEPKRIAPYVAFGTGLYRAHRRMTDLPAFGVLVVPALGIQFDFDKLVASLEVAARLVFDDRESMMFIPIQIGVSAMIGSSGSNP
jgi:hypothetical protein